MSDYASILESTREAFASVARLERALMTSPDDVSLQINLRSRKRLAERFQEDLFRAAQETQIDVCQYRLIPNSKQKYSVSSVTKSIERFQELFSLVYDSLTTGPKNTARISTVASQTTELEFGYSYPGSLGLMLSIPGDRDLFSGKFDDSIDALQQIFEIQNRDEVIDLARSLGRGVVNKAFDWSSENFKADFSVDVVWRKANGQQKGALVDKKRMAHMVNIIGLTSEKQTTPLSVRGVLVGIDVPSRWFHFVVPDGDSFKGEFGPDFSIIEPWAVNRLYQAKILATTVIKYATETAQTRYELQSLVEILEG